MKRAILLALFLALSCSQCGHGTTNGAPSLDASTDGPASLGPFGSAPALTSTTQLTNLSGPVNVIRDKNGLVHIWATNTTDALRVEGYQCAKDRTAQLELQRRLAEGRLAEILPFPAAIDQDIAMRFVGMGRVAKQIYDSLSGDLKTWLDAYADGVSQFYARVQSGAEDIPKSMIGIAHSAFTPWTGVDVIAVGRLESFELSYQGDADIQQTNFVQAANTQFSGTKRAGINIDLLRFAPIDTTVAMNGYPNDPKHALWRPATGASRALVPTPAVSQSVLDSAEPVIQAMQAVRNVLGKLGVRGSNDWVVGPQRTATGHAMIANDPHFGLSAPAVFWHVQLDVHDPTTSDTSNDMHFEGLSFPGVPAIVLGFNQNIAWGATTTDYDATDVFSEKLTPDGSAVVFNGQNVPLQKVTEQIAIAGSPPFEYDVLIVPHHGPILPTIVNHRPLPPDPTKGALSVEWVGAKPSNELAAVAGILRAKNVEDFRTAIRNYGVGSLNWVVADTSGNIFYTTQSSIPLRDKRAYTWDPKTFSGTIPCMVEPGDGTAEWTGQFLDEAFVPHVKNPPQHYVGTANGDVIGDTLDNDPTNDLLPNGQPNFLSCWHDAGFRVGRIHQLIESLGHPMSLNDMATIQADARSAMGAKLAPVLLTSLAHAQTEATKPGSFPGLTAQVTSARYQAANVAQIQSLLTQWGTDGYDTPAGVSLDNGSLVSDPTQTADSQATLLFQTWLVRAMQAVLGDELTTIKQNPPSALQFHGMPAVLTYLLTADPHSLATFDPTTGDSALFDDMTTPNVIETRDEDQVLSLLDAIDFLTTKLGSDRNQWRWGKLHTLTLAALVPLWPALSIPPIGDPQWPNGFPRHGDGYNIDVGGPPAEPVNLADATFTYAGGPAQRFVIDMDPSGPVARNVLPGGEIWDNQSPHFRDEMELWRRNENHAVPFSHADVLAAAESRVQYRP